MPSPEHMKLGDRKAFALLAAYIQSVDRELEPDAGDLEVVHFNIQRAAAAAADDRGSDELGAFLCSTSEQLSIAILGLPGLEKPQVVRDTLDRFRTRAAAIRCAFCANGAVCNGRDFAADDAVVASAEGGRCVREVKAAFEDARALALAAYHTDLSGRPPPELILSTDGRKGVQGQVPGISLAVNGTTEYFDTGAMTKVSRIEIVIAPLQLNRLSLAALPYVLLHEVFCHAFQMASRFSERPNKKGKADPLSEGIMDALAVDLLKARVHEANIELSEKVARQDAADAAEMIHDARASLLLKPRFPEATAVALGVAILRELRVFLDPQSVERLACQLNLDGWTIEERNRGLSKLLRDLLKRDDNLIGLIADYAIYGRPAPLMAYLTSS